MKILVVSNLYPPTVLGGYEIECSQVVEGLIERGHQVEVLTSDYLKPDKESVAYPIYRELKLIKPFDQPVHSSLRHTRKKVDAYNQGITQKKALSFKPDIVFLWSLLRIGIGPVRVVQHLHLPYYWRFGDEYINAFKPPEWGLKPRQLLRYFLDNTYYHSNTYAGLDFSRVACISRMNKNNILDDGLDVSQAEVIYKGIPLEKFPMKSSSGSLSKLIKVLYVGSLLRYKGVHNVIEAIKIVQDRHSVPIECNLIGGGNTDYIHELKNLSIKYHVKTHFLGKIPFDHLGPYYRENDIFIFPSLWQEPLGSTYLEAMASGLPVISSNDGGQNEVLTHETTALLYPNGDVQALAEALERLIKDSGLRKRLILEGRKLIETKYSMITYLDNIEQFLNSK
jgi:glycosyltransferase involved in cell wall biosynthesis